MDNSVTKAASYVDLEQGLVDRRIFSDAAIYRQELSNIFGRAWHFMAHQSQLKEVGDYFLSYIGEDQVIVVRAEDGEPQVLLNTCPHRGNTVCRAEFGNTKRFLCSYHGWNYDLKGNLVGVPGYEKFYKDTLDKSQWGMTPAAQVDSYKGFIFATLDSQAPPLPEYLGWVGRLGIDLMGADRDLQVVPGIQKNRIGCNWKLAVDNLYDWYHPRISHGSAMRVGMLSDEILSPDSQLVMLGEYGHGIGGPYITDDESEKMAALTQAERVAAVEKVAPSQVWRQQESARTTLGPLGSRSTGHPNIFPNLWVSTGGTQLSLRIPKGPLATEVWWFTFVDRNASPENQALIVKSANRFFGPAGILEQDDGENWSHSTRTSRAELAMSERPLNFSMGNRQVEMGAMESGQRGLQSVVSEHGQLWTYRSWAEWMDAKNWPDLISNHSAEPVGRV